MIVLYCTKCGSQLTDDGLCPTCNTVVAEPAKPEEKKKLRGPEPGARNYAAIFTALLVFPASLCTAVDLSFHRYDFWFGYVVGAILVVWVCAVLPVLNITPAPITALICFVSIVGYVFYVLMKTGHIEWLFQRALPLFILFAVFVAIDVAMISSRKIDHLAILSAISFEIGVYIIAIEATYTKSLANLHWSPILACGFISVSAIFIAFSYIGKSNKKNK